MVKHVYIEEGAGLYGIMDRMLVALFINKMTCEK